MILFLLNLLFIFLSGKYRARIMVDRVEIHLGRFETTQEAGEARKKAEIKYFGEFARQQP